MTAGRITTMVALLMVALLFQPGCSGPPTSTSHDATPVSGPHILTPAEAAVLAARLANDECERQFKKRPFSPEQHAAVLQKARFRWGGLDVAGKGGFSALVTFRSDGTDPHVEVYFSSDLSVR